MAMLLPRGLLVILVVTTWGCYWHLVGGGQGCHPTPYNAQDSPTENNPAPNISSVEDEKVTWMRETLSACLPAFLPIIHLTIHPSIHL